MRLEIQQRWFRWAPLVVCSMLAAGCFHPAPMPYGAQRDEAQALGRILKALKPEVLEEVMSEQKVARELRITLDELAKLSYSQFIKRYNSYTEQLVAIKKKRREILQALDSSQWNSPLVAAIQEGGVRQLQQDQERNQKWLELADGVRLRVELGRRKDFPELVELSRQLDIFLATPTDPDPFANRLQVLKEAFGLSEADFD
jgi:hypothetical protein